MRIGVPKEIKTHEYRVGLTPASVRELTSRGHTVRVQQGAGSAIGYTDQQYTQMGAVVVPSAEEVFASSDLIVKVKEPQACEYALLKAGQILYTYLHLAADQVLTQALLRSGTIAIAYETITDAEGRLPLLAPMSEVAGRMAVQVGAHYLEKHHGGVGVLLGGVPGVPAGKIAVLGAGVVGTNALAMAVGLGAHTTVLDNNLERLRQLDHRYGNRVQTCFASTHALEDAIVQADLVIGSVLVPGARAPRLVNRELVAQMKPGSVIVDVAIDQGGCFETSRPTTHADPTYWVEGVQHYCVTNMPGAVARTATVALNHATIGHALALAEQGWQQAVRADLHLCNGLNVADGHITHPAVARAWDLPHVDPQSLT